MLTLDTLPVIQPGRGGCNVQIVNPRPSALVPPALCHPHAHSHCVHFLPTQQCCFISKDFRQCFPLCTSQNVLSLSCIIVCICRRVVVTHKQNLSVLNLVHGRKQEWYSVSLPLPLPFSSSPFWWETYKP